MARDTEPHDKYQSSTRKQCKGRRTEGKHDNHKDLGASRRKRDSEAIVILGRWFDLRNPFDTSKGPKLLVSFATGYVSNEERLN